MIDKPSTLDKNSNVIIDLYTSNKWLPKLKPILNILSYVNIKESEYTDIIKIYKNKPGKLISTDYKIFTDLLKIKYKAENMYTEKSDIKRAFNKWSNIKHSILTHFTKQDSKISGILDYGGNIGTTASILGRKILKLPKNMTLVVDVDAWGGNKWVPRNDITFFSVANMKNISSKCVDLITCFHTLHHIPQTEYANILQNFHRILSDKGCVVIYEHNCESKEWAGIIDLEHAFYDIIVSKKLSYNNFVKKEHYAKYLSIDNWKKLFAKFGFKVFFISETKNKDNSFYMYFTKDSF
jgi:SAM-dependent methyltransferase